jgi:replicative DNA helicase
MDEDSQAGKIIPFRPRQPSHLELYDFLNEPEPEYDWLIPGVLEKADRVILTGTEGYGKSTLLRQMCIQVAAGIHPFTLQPMDAQRTMLIDLENPRRHLRRKIGELVQVAQPAVGMVCVDPIPQGIDLLNPIHAEFIEARIREHRPALICAGPTYKMASGDPIDEKTARALAAVLDRLRTDYQCALIIEAHQPYAQGGTARPERPYGASLWSRWPEFGINLANDGQLKHWRGERDERQWPRKLAKDGVWPWVVAETWQPTEQWDGHTQRQQACLKVLEQQPDMWLTSSQIAALVPGRKQITLDALKELATADKIDAAPGANRSVVYRHRPNTYNEAF